LLVTCGSRLVDRTTPWPPWPLILMVMQPGALQIANFSLGLGILLPVKTSLFHKTYKKKNELLVSMSTCNRKTICLCYKIIQHWNILTNWSYYTEFWQGNTEEWVCPQAVSSSLYTYIISVKGFQTPIHECLSPLKLWIWIPLMATQYNIMW
jgi:hypothetical protein